jgi:hypothetical protein
MSAEIGTAIDPSGSRIKESERGGDGGMTSPPSVAAERPSGTSVFDPAALLLPDYDGDDHCFVRPSRPGRP